MALQSVATVPLTASGPMTIDASGKVKDLLNDASCKLACLRGMLRILETHLEGGEDSDAVDAVYGIEALLTVAKEKLDQAIGEVEFPAKAELN